MLPARIGHMENLLRCARIVVGEEQQMMVGSKASLNEKRLSRFLASMTPKVPGFVAPKKQILWK